ncbi:MAG: nucleoside 2-deoxyribosyltransferase domain-containing protein [Alphaproteobacteria bacterium]
MRVIYAREQLPAKNAAGKVSASIFLAGPTPRDKLNVLSWRPHALDILASQNFKGIVFVPEDADNGLSGDFKYTDQTRWEIQALGRSSAIVFWIPRQMATMPALTTNTEFGFCVALAPERLVLGAPPEAAKVGYQKQLARDLAVMNEAFGLPSSNIQIPILDNLEETLRQAVNIACPI